MERLRRISAFWNWLPAFRAVAETEHLPAAAERLHVSASALSRSIRLLEEDIGQPLFRRGPRRIYLNEAGQALLSATRLGMRTIHEALLVITGDELVGPLYVVSAETLALPCVLPALQELRSRCPKLVPHLSTDIADAQGKLLRGEIDVALVPETRVRSGLHMDAIGTVTSEIYCGKGHPLWNARRMGTKEISKHAFVSIPNRKSAEKAWLDEHAHSVALHVDSLHAMAEVCTTGRALAILPSVFAASFVKESTLRKVPARATQELNTTFIAITREPIRTGRAEVLVRAVKVLTRDTFRNELVPS